MPQPYALINGPVTIYIAPTGTPMPEISEDPPAIWEQLGVNGPKSYGEDGVTITPESTESEIMVLGSTAPQKVFRTEEHLLLTVSLKDITIETLAKAMNNAAVTDVVAATGTGGYRSMPMLRGSDVTTVAVLVRGKSSYGDGFNAQHRIPMGYVASVGGFTYEKGDAAMVELEIRALEHDSQGFADYQDQYAVAR